MTGAPDDTLLPSRGRTPALRMVGMSPVSSSRFSSISTSSRALRFLAGFLQIGLVRFQARVKNWRKDFQRIGAASRLPSRRNWGRPGMMVLRNRINEIQKIYCTGDIVNVGRLFQRISVVLSEILGRLDTFCRLIAKGVFF